MQPTALVVFGLGCVPSAVRAPSQCLVSSVTTCMSGTVKNGVNMGTGSGARTGPVSVRPLSSRKINATTKSMGGRAGAVGGAVSCRRQQRQKTIKAAESPHLQSW